MGVGEPALWSYLRIKTRIEKHPMIQCNSQSRFFMNYKKIIWEI